MHRRHCMRLPNEFRVEGIVILLSDLLSDSQKLMQALHHLRYRKHEIIVFQILSEEELTFPYNDAVQFRDLEGTIDDIDLDPASIRAEYLRQFTSFLNDLEQSCRSIPVDYVRLNTKDSYVSALTNYLGHRNGGRQMTLLNGVAMFAAFAVIVPILDSPTEAAQVESGRLARDAVLDADSDQPTSRCNAGESAAVAATLFTGVAICARHGTTGNRIGAALFMADVLSACRMRTAVVDDGNCQRMATPQSIHRSDGCCISVCSCRGDAFGRPRVPCRFRD